MNLKQLNKVSDSTLSRLFNLLNNQVCAIITAYRDTDSNGKKLTIQENIKRNRDLRARFNSNKMGVYQLVGHWQEAPDGYSYEQAKKEHKLTDVTERSYVVPKPKDMDTDEFIKFILESMTVDGLTQDACIIHTDKFYLMYKDGTVEDLGTKVNINKLGQAYSQWVRKSSMPFVFDSVDTPTSNMGRMYYTKCNILYFK